MKITEQGLPEISEQLPAQADTAPILFGRRRPYSEGNLDIGQLVAVPRLPTIDAA